MDRKLFWVGTIILVVIILAAGVGLYIKNQPASYAGSIIDPPVAAHNFTLTDQQGKPVSLSDYRGKYVLLYFGFTHCTQECPATMAILAKTRSLLGSQASDIQVVLVSTDPARDTPQAMGAFVGKFDPSFIGVTGTQAQLQPVWNDYGVTVLDNGETHSSYIYMIDPKGNMTMTWPYSTTAEQLTADLKTLLRRS